MKFKVDSNNIFVVILMICIIILIKIPTGFENPSAVDSTRCKAEVLSVDNSDLQSFGIVKRGTQLVKVQVKNGKYKNEIFDSSNLILGKLELDKVFSVGDKALMVIETKNGEVTNVNIIDFYRMNIEFIFLMLFIGLLILISGWTGVKAVLSFIFTIMMIWKILLPCFLKGYDPIPLTFFIVLILTFVIIFLIAGFNKKGLSAFLGATTGILLTCILAIIFGHFFKVNGAVVPFSETLLYSGFAHLKLTKIFLAGIFLASSGAVMDIAMDIAASVSEVAEKKPDITTKDLILSGLNVSRAVIGTMTTTLLLAYSGGYTAMLMVFIAQGVPVINIINLKYVSSEILHTLVGSFGLVLVAPITAIIAGLIFKHKQVRQKIFLKKSNGTHTNESPVKEGVLLYSSFNEGKNK